MILELLLLLLLLHSTFKKYFKLVSMSILRFLGVFASNFVVVVFFISFTRLINRYYIKKLSFENNINITLLIKQTQ